MVSEWSSPQSLWIVLNVTADDYESNKVEGINREDEIE
jgi:hypothetical protein